MKSGSRKASPESETTVGSTMSDGAAVKRQRTEKMIGDLDYWKQEKESGERERERRGEGRALGIYLYRGESGIAACP